jgi:GTP-binding protein
MSSLPIVAIVGRANVGKSSIFNRLIGYKQAIEADQPGTTRDPVYGEVDVNGRGFLLIDTAGLKSPEDDFEMSIQQQITEATAVADMIIVTVESMTQVTDEDRRAAKMALKSQKPVVLALNKYDKFPRKESTDRWQRLGIKTMIPTSATQNMGLDNLLEEILATVPARDASDDSDLKIALLGRPNAGKSALFNALGQKQQAIVSEQQGTTRDINRLNINYHGKKITWLDTAGIRKPGKIGYKSVEQFSVMRSVSAINEADVCCLLIDVNETKTKLDQKIAGMIKEASKPLILVVSKWDSMDKDAYTRDQLAKSISLEYQFVNWAPLIFTSAVTGQNVTKLYDLALEGEEQANREFETSELNDWLEEAVAKHFPAGYSTAQPKLKYAVQVGHKPPRIRLFGRQTDMIHWSYKRYLERTFRQKFDLTGTPIEFSFGDDNQEDD